MACNRVHRTRRNDVEGKEEREADQETAGPGQGAAQAGEKQRDCGENDLVLSRRREKQMAKAKTTAELTKEVESLKGQLAAIWELLRGRMDGDGRVTKAEAAAKEAVDAMVDEG